MRRILAKWRIGSRKYSFDIQREEDQQMNNIDHFLLTNFIEYQKYLINLNENFENGLIHKSFP